MVEENLTVMQMKMTRLIILKSSDKRWRFSIKILHMTKSSMAKMMVKMLILVKNKRAQGDTYIIKR